jgi:hypothetical protein
MFCLGLFSASKIWIGTGAFGVNDTTACAAEKLP